MHDALFGGEDARELRTAATLRSSFSLTVLTSGCWLASPSGHSALYFAIDADLSGIEISTVGLILMIIGIIGLIITLFFLGGWRGRHRTVVEERPVVRDREYY